MDKIKELEERVSKLEERLKPRKPLTEKEMMEITYNALMSVLTPSNDDTDGERRESYCK